MRRIWAFLTALLLFAATAAGCHFYAAGRVSVNNPAFSTWTEEAKANSLAGLTRNMNEESFPVFGSSEFQHGEDTAYHPKQVFAQTQFNPMLIGAGYYQSLSHAITLAAIEDSMTQRKAVLIVSPQWFRKAGVLPQAYASRFSELLYEAALTNDSLSDETKQYIAERTETLLSADEKTLERVKLYNQVILQDGGTALQALEQKLWNAFLQEKDMFSIAAREQAAGISEGSGILSAEESTEPDWDALTAQAEADGGKENQNQFYIDDTSYRLLESFLDKKKGINSDAVKGYQNSPEYDDLRCFLQVCAETGVKPMLVLLPVNGYYYDWTGFPASARQAYYEKVKGVAEEFGAEIADFTDQEYTKYFFEDRVHIGKKGWVMVNEKLWEFYEEE